MNSASEQLGRMVPGPLRATRLGCPVPRLLPWSRSARHGSPCNLAKPFVVSGHLTVVGGLDVVPLTRVVRGVFRMQLVQPVVLVGHGHVVLGCLR